MNEVTVRGYHLSFLFLEIFGEKWYFERHHDIKLSDYKSYLIKLVDAFQCAVRDTIEITDASHRREINALVTSARAKIKKAKTFNVISVLMIDFQTRLIFTLLGQVPNNSDKKNVTNHAGNWQLRTYRTLSYSQSKTQKEILFLDLAKTDTFKAIFASYKDMKELYRVEKQKDEKMLDWFKRKYPFEYLEHFDTN